MIHVDTGDAMLLPKWCGSWICGNTECQAYRIEKFFIDWEDKNFKYVGWTTKKDYYSRVRSLIKDKGATVIMAATDDDTVRWLVSDSNLNGRSKNKFMREVTSLEAKQEFRDLLASGTVRRTSPGPDNFQTQQKWYPKGRFDQTEEQQLRLLMKAGYKQQNDNYYVPEDEDSLTKLEFLVDD